jgi:hypothetical protein
MEMKEHINIVFACTFRMCNISFSIYRARCFDFAPGPKILRTGPGGTLRHLHSLFSYDVQHSYFTYYIGGVVAK